MKYNALPHTQLGYQFKVGPKPSLDEEGGNIFRVKLVTQVTLFK